ARTPADSACPASAHAWSAAAQRSPSIPAGARAPPPSSSCRRTASRRSVSMAARILIADDHQLLREGLRSLLEQQGFEVVGESENGRGAVNLVRKLKPDALIIDINMPILNGIEATRLLRKQAPQLKVVVLSMLCDSRTIFQALAAGASGYLLKDAAFDEMVMALKAALQGQTFLSPAVAHVVVQSALASAPAS